MASFLENALEALNTMCAKGITVTPIEPPRVVYDGLFGDTCPDCEAAIGEEHRAACCFAPDYEERRARRTASASVSQTSKERQAA